MPKFKLIYDVPHDAPQYLGAIEDVTADDDTINAALPNAAVGTLITAAGYRAMKQKQADGSWKPFSYTPSESGWVNPSDATATAADILSGKTAYIADGSKATGSIPSKAAQTYTPTTADQTIAAGQYLSGAQTVKGDANLVAGNIKKDVTIFGVTGNWLGYLVPKLWIGQAPTKTTYVAGETFDPTGAEVYANIEMGGYTNPMSLRVYPYYGEHSEWGPIWSTEHSPLVEGDTKATVTFDIHNPEDPAEVLYTITAEQEITVTAE